MIMMSRAAISDSLCAEKQKQIPHAILTQCRGMASGWHRNSRGARSISPQVFENFQRCKAPRRAHDSAAGMRGGAAHIKIFDGSAITRPSCNRPQEEKLLERKFALKNIAFGQADLLLNVPRTEHLLADDDFFQVRRIFGDRVDHRVAKFVAAIFPRALFE